ncbi:hypothetical protein GFS24_05840 [Chitinophaga sp. SYP-B3965]|uniref:PepSY-like domain-containing protein n=1 Tax=Chitinophaga sp. SYP-B3965 TaxID=2663120 RepID=UPI001299C51E|nr:PepSY-like domain-containing protein [Chitinophaga sp. SYP-B3965]MRG44624.1 hypothetical protein [Chitinophaga sp. SYP-B3965]
MKTIMLLVALFMHPQEIPKSQVPTAVKNALKARFPKTSSLDWEKKGELYEADFDVKDVDHKALIDATGKLVAVKYDIRTAQLPQAVRNTVNTQYKGYKINDTEKVERNGVVYYQVELDAKPLDKHLIIKGDGKIDTSQQYW